MAYSAFVGRVLDHHNHSIPFTLYPQAWASFPGVSLTWTTVPFEGASLGSVTAARGVYAFVLEPARWALPALPDSGYVLYVGEVGDDNSRTLQDRMHDYLTKPPHSPRMEVMFALYRDHLTFRFAAVPAGTSTRTVETALADALLPPFNQRDFSSEIRSIQRAFP